MDTKHLLRLGIKQIINEQKDKSNVIKKRIKKHKDFCSKMDKEKDLKKAENELRKLDKF
ncbi:hypothetical protein ACFL21_01520 [Patescibacteria group bacterium]